MRLLDVGCGWGGMVRHAVKNYGVTALGVTLSRQQAAWAARPSSGRGSSDLAEVRHRDYRDVPRDRLRRGQLDRPDRAHRGASNYPAYFAFLRDRLRDGGRLLNHCITRPDNRHAGIPRAASSTATSSPTAS